MMVIYNLQKSKTCGVLGFKIYRKPSSNVGREPYYRAHGSSVAKYQDVSLTPRMTKELQFIELLQLLDSEKELVKNNISFEHADEFQ